MTYSGELARKTRQTLIRLPNAEELQDRQNLYNGISGLQGIRTTYF